MFPTRVFVRFGGLALAGALTLGAMGANAQPVAWTPAERSLALATLREAGELKPAPYAAPTDDALTAAILRHAQIETGQRLRPSAVDSMWAIEPPRRDVAVELADARRDGRLAAWLAGLSPPEPAYRALADLALRYRQMVERGGWGPLPKSQVFGIGNRGAPVAALRLRLSAEGYDIADTFEPAVFDASLKEALKAFQHGHGLPETGRLDAVTRAALDVPAKDRLAQIEANLERWRWLPHVLPADRLELDVAGQSAVLFAAGAPVLDMKVIVGQPRHRTPMFISQLTSVVFDPPWNVPSDIAQKEILPKARKDPGYLARNRFVFVDGHLQQLPGPKNALGDIKFDLPSPFGVYLHDTSARSLFGRQARALSHGCMRLEKPQALAEALLAPQGWTAQAVADAVGAGHTQATPLKRTLPLYVLYWTVTAQPGGPPLFRQDIYGWDQKLTEALAAAAAPPPLALAAAPETGCAVVTG